MRVKKNLPRPANGKLESCNHDECLSILKLGIDIDLASTITSLHQLRKNNYYASSIIPNLLIAILHLLMHLAWLVSDK
ncbi:unnamed protein product [Blepharisma stoltei]|uniref:Uncharacterized protein n=1 Tax=Blepharisma stoltei TaxID=1481888 RepID=A0AAU9K8Y3_9CILI|nr:unnamed protein product [Blepharisma stoltei]